VTTPPEAGLERPARTRWPRWVFRIASVIAAVLLFDQAVYAGQFLDGTYDSLHAHRENATYAGISVLVLLISAILLRWPGRGPWWPIVACVGIFALIALQIALGFARAISIHVPLGVATILLAVALSAWAWRRP
jgi:hypothetical protein